MRTPRQWATRLRAGAGGSASASYPYAGHDMTGVETFPRWVCDQGLNLQAGSPAGIYFSYFTPQSNLLCGNVATFFSTAPTSATLGRMGIYSVAGNGDLTLVASTANNTTFTSNALYQRPLTTPYQLVAGTRYAFTILVITGGSAGTCRACALYPQMAALSPRLSSQSTLQYTDLPASVTNANLLTFGQAGHHLLTT